MSIPARRPLRTQGRVTSEDGTPIAYESIGAGPCVILVSGGLDDGSENEPLARELAAGFSVYNYARRGGGASGDTLPYAVQREVEDIEALLAMAGGRAHLYGVLQGARWCWRPRSPVSMGDDHASRNGEKQ